MSKPVVSKPTAMQDNDSVTLMVILRDGYLQAPNLSRKFASDLILHWYNGRCVLANKDDPKREEVKHAIDTGTYVANFGAEDRSYAGFAFCWNQVIAMYTLDNAHNLQRQYTETAKKMVDLMEKQASGEFPGEEWKKNRDEGDEGDK